MYIRLLGKGGDVKSQIIVPLEDRSNIVKVKCIIGRFI